MNSPTATPPVVSVPVAFHVAYHAARSDQRRLTAEVRLLETKIRNLLAQLDAAGLVPHEARDHAAVAKAGRTLAQQRGRLAERQAALTACRARYVDLCRAFLLGDGLAVAPGPRCEIDGWGYPGYPGFGD